MKKVFIFLVLLLSIVHCKSQVISFLPHLVDDNFDGPAGIYISDLNGDSLKDIICAGADANTIAWWQNMGDHPVSWTKQIIDDDFRGAIYISAGDVDGDSLTDVLGAAWEDHELAWWKNSGGDSTSWTKYVIKTGFGKAHEIMPYDLDKDGDMDVIGVSAGLHSISWFENDGNWPINWTEHEIVDDFEGARSVDAKDIDGDGDIDLAGAALLDHEIAWWRNDGGDTLKWTKFIVGSGFTYAHKVQIVDIDKDEQPDILGTAYNNGLSWWKNDGEDSITWTKQFISFFGSAVIGYAIDPDMDNDMDIVCSAQTANGKIGMWTNNGELPLVWDYNLIESDLAGSWPLHYGDLDKVCGGNGANEIRWYENDLVTSTESPESNDVILTRFKCHPVPFNDQVKFTISLEKTQFVELQVFDISGKVIATLVSGQQFKGEHQFIWHGQNYYPGIYFAQLLFENRRETIKLIKTK